MLRADLQTTCEPLYQRLLLTFIPYLEIYSLIKHGPVVTFPPCPLDDPDPSQHPMLLRGLPSSSSLVSTP